MPIHSERVSSTLELLNAINRPNVSHIIISKDLHDAPTLRLLPGQTLKGENQDLSIHFLSGHDGIQLSSNNRLENLKLIADIDQRTIFNDTSVDSLGHITLKDLHVIGLVQILACDLVRHGHVEAHNIHIASADARGYEERPKGYGVEVIPGVFTLWNQQADPAITITANLTGLSAGYPGKPVYGSGIFISGAGDIGGRLVAQRLETGAVYSNGGIAPGIANRITGGVFTVYGAVVDSVVNRGPVTTYGQNDMVLDNWGTVNSWLAEDKITSYGPSGVGFVNFGTLNTLHINAPIETFGQGARGFNVYAGTVRSSLFERIVTHADGAVGIQLSQPIETLCVLKGIETYGGSGESLVKGVVTTLSAIGLSLHPGSSALEIRIEGGIITHGENINPIELQGSIEKFKVSDGIRTGV